MPGALPPTVPLGIAVAALVLVLLPLAYPGLVRLLGWISPRPRPGPGAPPSGISAVVCHVGETEALRNAGRAFLDSQAEEVPLELVLVADGATPDSLGVARELAGDPRVRLLGGPGRLGKAERQLQGVRAAAHPIVLLLDANTCVRPGTPLRLATPLGDPGVAYTTGRLRYLGSGQGAEDTYWELEHRIRMWEDRWRGVLGASGGLLACRKRDYAPSPPEAMLDLVIPCLLERLTGGRGLYVPEAEAIEPGRPNVAAWARARTRIQSRALSSSGLLRGWLAGAGADRAFQYLGHKFLRWHLATSMGVLAIALVVASPGFGLFLLGISGLALAASAAAALAAGGRPSLPVPALPGYAFLAQASGLVRALRGRAPRAWTP